VNNARTLSPSQASPGLFHSWDVPGEAVRCGRLNGEFLGVGAILEDGPAQSNCSARESSAGSPSLSAGEDFQDQKGTLLDNAADLGTGCALEEKKGRFSLRGRPNRETSGRFVLQERRQWPLLFYKAKGLTLAARLKTSVKKRKTWGGGG